MFRCMISQILIPLKMCSLYKTHLFQHGRVEESETEVGEKTEPRYLKCLSRNDGQLVQVSLFYCALLRETFTSRACVVVKLLSVVVALIIPPKSW